MRAEYAAFKARIVAHPMLAGKLFSSVRLTSGVPVQANYLVSKSAVPDRLGDGRFTAVQQAVSDRRFTYDVRVVAVDVDGLDLLTDALMGQLIGHILTVEGRSCSPISLVEALEEADAEFDRAAGLFWRDLSFRFWSRRA